MSLNQNGEMVVLRGGAYKALVGIVLGFMALVGITPIVTGQVLGEVFGGAYVLGMGVWCVRWFRAAIYADPAHLVLRAPFRTRSLDWDQVKEARVVPSNGNRIVAVVRVTTIDGKRILVDGVGNRWRRAGGNSAVYRMVAEINRRAMAAHSSQAW